MKWLGTYFSKEKIWVFFTNSSFQISKSLQPDGVNLCYVKLKYFQLFMNSVIDQIIKDWYIKGFNHHANI